MKQPTFKRGLDPDFIEHLNEMYDSGNWWRNLVDNKELFLAIRDNSINIYYCGCSLIKLRWNKQQKNHHSEIHYKYLLRPTIQPSSKYIEIIDGTPCFPEDMMSLFLEDINDIETLKRGATPYAGNEKTGVHDAILENSNVLDIEIAIKEESSARRVDIAAIRKTEQVIKITFFEVKPFDSSDLRAEGNGNPKVFDQIDRYFDLLTRRREELEDSYYKVCSNLRKLKGIDKRHSERHELLESIAKSQNILKVDEYPRLLVFGFDADQQKGENWRPHREKLKSKLGSRVKFFGGAKNIRLDW